MKESIIKTKSYQFSLRIIKLYRHLAEDKKEYILSKRILRCGTYIGANVEEANAAAVSNNNQSRNGLISSAEKEAIIAACIEQVIKILEDKKER